MGPAEAGCASRPPLAHEVFGFSRQQTVSASAAEHAEGDGVLAGEAVLHAGDAVAHSVDGAAGVLVKKVKCDFKKLGPKFGKQMKAVAAAVAEMSQEAISELEKNGKYTLNLNGEEAVIEVSDVEIISEDIPGWLVANEGKLTVALEVTVTEELRREGIARELVNRIQNIRKSSGFEITDKIKITISKNTQTDDAVNEYNTYICNQVLGTSLDLADEVKDGTELNFDDFSLFVNVIKD